MHAFARPVLARRSTAALCLVLAGLLASCGGGGSASPAADPNQLSFDELVIPAGEERSLVAERVTIRSRFDVKGTLALSLPPGSSADRVVVSLPPGTAIEGTISLRQPPRPAAAAAPEEGRRHAQAAGPRSAAFVPRRVPALIVEGGIPNQALYIYSTARFESGTGDDAPQEMLADLDQLGGTGVYEGASGGNGGDIHILSNGVIVFRFPLGTPPNAFFQPFALGNGGKGADVVLDDASWNDAGRTKAVVRAGSGGNSGRLFVDAAEIRLEGDQPADRFIIQASDGYGVGGAGGKLTWEVVSPDLISIDRIELIAGSGGGGMTQGGPGGVARYAAGKPIVLATAPRPVSVIVTGGTGGPGGEDRSASPMAALSAHRTPKEPVVVALGGVGGQVTGIAHTGLSGTATRPEGSEPGPLDVRFGWGGDVATGQLFAGLAGDGAGMDANVHIRGGDGGAGYASCEPVLAVGGAGGRSGHLTIRAGIGGSGPVGGNAGVLVYDSVEAGLPGKGGKGLTPGPAGGYGEPDRPPLDPPLGIDVREHPGLRLEGVVGGESRDLIPTANSRLQGAYVPPARTPGETCGAAPPVTTGLIPLPPPTYRARSYMSNAPGEVEELEVTVLAGCMFFDPHTAAVFGPGGGSGAPQPCMNVHEVKRDVVNSPTGWITTDRTLNSFGNGDLLDQRTQQFIQRVSFCGIEGNLVLPGSTGFTERFEPIGTDGNVVPGLPTFIVEHSATGAPIYPAEAERTKNYCCAPTGHYPNGRGAGYVIRTVVDGVCVPPL